MLQRPARVFLHLLVCAGSAVFFATSPVSVDVKSISNVASGLVNSTYQTVHRLLPPDNIADREVVLDIVPRKLHGGDRSVPERKSAHLHTGPVGRTAVPHADDDIAQLEEYDRDGLDQLIADSHDWDAEIEFIVPKPVRVVRPRRPVAPTERLTRRLDKPLIVPTPKRAENRRRPGGTPALPPKLLQTELVAFNNSPFPYSGTVPGTKRRFLNAEKDGAPAHRTRRGRLYSAAATYSERRSLLHVPKGFNPDAPGVMVVFFHGHGAKLTRDIWKRQRLPDQISESGMNAVLVAPQFAVNARDSSIGNFWKPGALRDYLHEASEHLAHMIGRPDKVRIFDELPVVLVGYSGGYLPAAWGVAQGGINERLAGVVLLDALYGHIRTFSKWIERNPSTFFVSAYARSTRRGNKRLMEILAAKNRPYRTELGGEIRPGSKIFISSPVRHRSFVTRAWRTYPVADIVRRIPGVARQNPMVQQHGPRSGPRISARTDFTGQVR